MPVRMNDDLPDPATLRPGWTTGACATAAARAALEGLLTGHFPDPVTITLPGGQTPAFALASAERLGDGARVGIVKDAGDDPDVTHGALILATVTRLAPGSGIRFLAGPGVGTVTRPGLPLPPGEPAINPVPRKMMVAELTGFAARLGLPADFAVEISIPDGEKLAQRTMNGRLGILGGLSILGTTGIVVPYSCAAWIHAIHRGVDVARAAGLTHVIGSTGDTSEKAAQAFYQAPEIGLIDMGDFVGGLLKYLRGHPVPDVTIAGGFAKMTKLGQGLLDLHSKRGAVDLDWLAGLVPDALRPGIRAANSALDALEQADAAGVDLSAAVADAAWRVAAPVVKGARLEIMIVDRQGAIRATTGLRPLPHSDAR